LDRLKERLELAARALRSLAELEHRDQDAIIRDAAIKRFEYGFESVWKATKGWLAEHHGIEEASPKGVIRSAVKTGILTPAEGEVALRMADDRNLTVHTYNEALALEIAARVWPHLRLLQVWLDRVGKQTP
jgi:nucleotidyltransferase substrate binding protein (TIGR01987 family)